MIHIIINMEAIGIRKAQMILRFLKLHAAYPVYHHITLKEYCFTDKQYLHTP